LTLCTIKDFIYLLTYLFVVKFQALHADIMLTLTVRHAVAACLVQAPLSKPGHAMAGLLVVILVAVG